MEVIYARQPFPNRFSSSIFLAGPSPRDAQTVSWRPEFIAELQKQGYTGLVFSPESDPKQPRNFDYDTQVEWEQQGRNLADYISFWIPRQLPAMPGLITNVEFGQDLASSKIVYGRPASAEKCRYLDKLVTQNEIPIFQDIPTQVRHLLTKIGSGALRTGGECCIPLEIWRTRHFQAWLQAQKQGGNRLDDAKVLWNFRVGKQKFGFAYAIWVKIWVEAEHRYKANEFIVSRTDISVITPIWHHPHDPLQSKIVLIKEFRSPVRNSEAFVYELPAGSSSKSDEDKLAVATHELEEETGMRLAPARFTYLGSRQINASFSTHCAELFKVDLTGEEIVQAEAVAHSGQHFGVAAETERTYLEVKTVQEIFQSNLLDCAMLGIISQALMSS